MEKEYVSELAYNSIFDEAWAMARILQKIEEATHQCAMCKGDGRGGSISTDDYLREICEILYSAEGYHKMDKYNKQNS